MMNVYQATVFQMETVQVEDPLAAEAYRHHVPYYVVICKNKG